MIGFKDYVKREEKNNLKEGYTFFPKTEDDISTTLSHWPHENVNDVISLFNLLKNKGDDTPINIDLKKQKDINVSRSFKSQFDINDIKNQSSLKKVRIKFGNGSKGNRGSNNRGNAFETLFANNLNKWFSEGNEAVEDKEILKSILDLDKIYNLSNSKTLTVNVVGGENTKRPLDFSGQITVSNKKGTGNDIGESVTDITLIKDDGTKIYLSLKFETTTTFFNVGVRTKLTPKEIKEGKIQNIDGLKLLDLFGIDNERFCSIFNDDVKTQSGKVITRPNSSAIKTLLESGIGYGYHVIHKMRKQVYSSC